MSGNQASAVPQGDDQRRARPESEDVTDQPAATQIRVEEARRPQWTISSTVKDILLEGNNNRSNMMLNDFLRSYLGGRGVVDTNENVAMEMFVLRPTMFINDSEILGMITASPSYQELEAIYKLHHGGVHFLEQWRDYQGKATLTPLVCEKLNGVLAQVLRKEKREANERAMLEAAKVPEAVMLEGCYESVYNASWHHVVEVPGGEGTRTGTAMEVKEGKRKQSWKYNEVGDTPEKDDGVEQSGAERLRLMVLTSEKGWPYSWKRGVSEIIPDCYVNSEVERVWQIVIGDLTEWFSIHGGNNPSPKRRVLIGTPGIGKSMNAGSYLLYQLLHYDAERLPMVAYFIGSQSFLFDKITRTVKKCSGASSIVDILDGLSDRGVKGYIIYDVALASRQPPAGLPCKGWGMIVVTSPNTKNYYHWTKIAEPEKIIINCPEENDVKAMCIWMKHNRRLPEEKTEEEADYWKKVKERMDEVGPILRFIFNEKKCKDRFNECEGAVNSITGSMLQYYTGIGTGKSCDGNHVSHKLVKVVRVRKDNIESHLNVLISPHFERETFSKMKREMRRMDFTYLVLSIWDYVIPQILEDEALDAFLNEDFLRAIRSKIEELKLTGRPEPHSCALKVHSNKSFTRKEVLPENPSKRIAIEYWVLYKPVTHNFPLVDGFFFVDSKPKIMVGLQITTAREHHTIPSTVELFTERMAEYFNGWEELSRDMSWEIIYVQHADSTPMKKWQRCDYVNPNNETDAEEKIVAFWDGKVHQYQFVLTPDFVNKIR
ncbi:putative retrotransposon hot spot (RHS) protein [Trypanosoma cruzi]|uniref:Retrotransposon hot spot (RHS) protein, putative n=1 Tax=Trypanosoma cruzi (strain CL Brener) TaxID=353153 RepID=Q4DWB1_TRYCC|nr:retrotransposon hot spot (RHS) protein, putative [Trypanosoma cruzi]EAN96809.1 retrotransposon hot spot (RHS) protein, putative [Trypanosoma cruzi]RNC41648.1 putative retrotransposon hot spot (RHS) protein [Trypanosoma cruzi]|eukprot:XP_818660.1 retrotransposon hot spot (RHS) protein [Trypanosoma cruzi strain CL Brener]